MKNIVVMPNFKEDQNTPNMPFIDNCAKSWEIWCEKNDADFYIITEPLQSFYAMPPQIQKMYTIQILKGSNIEFDQIAQVDHDVFVLPHCPNFFNLTNKEFGAGLDGGFGPQLNRSIQMCKKNWFPDSKLAWDCYFNSGFIIYNAKHEPAFQDVLDFYNTEKEKWLEVNKSPNLTDDQTLLNFFLEKRGLPVHWLPRSYNVLDPWNRYFFYDATDELGRYINSIETIRQCVNVFHFCGDNDYRNRVTQLLKEKFL